MFPEFQSAYRKYHSTETVLLRMRNDILASMNKQQVTLLVFLDLSAALIWLLQRPEYKFGIKDQAVTCFKSYLSNRSQRIVIGSAKSDCFDLKFGVPQGSCLGPMLFSLYTNANSAQLTPMIPVSIWHSIQTMIPIKTPPLRQWKRASVISVAGWSMKNSWSMIPRLNLCSLGRRRSYRTRMGSESIGPHGLLSQTPWEREE